MAKRRKRRSRVGSIQDTGMEFLALVAGSYIGNVARKAANKDNKAKKDELPYTIGETVIGLAVAHFAPQAFLKNIGMGMAVDGASGSIADSITGVRGTTLNRRGNAVGSYNGGGKLNAETTFEIV